VSRTGDVEDLARKLGQVLLPGSRLPGDTPPVGNLVRERYDWGRLTDQTETVYRQALARRGLLHKPSAGSLEPF
jgi:hypothetical protein